jgi:predicted 3-demethylubiquinone-9 3-methyltransferase (glyoxalase superfamily)
MFTGYRKVEQRITPTLMFVGELCGRAEEAINFYASVFHNAKVGHILRYGAKEEPDKEGTVRHAGVELRRELCSHGQRSCEQLHFQRRDFLHGALQYPG